MSEKRDSLNPTTATVLHWTTLVLLTAFLAGTIVLGVTGVLGEANVSRIVLGLLVVIAYVLRRGPPPPHQSGELGTLLVLAGVSSELAAALTEGGIGGG